MDCYDLLYYRVKLLYGLQNSFRIKSLFLEIFFIF